MASDVYQVVGECESCVKTRGTNYSHQNNINRFPAYGELEMIAIYVLVTLPRTKRWNPHVLFMNARYQKLTRAIPLTNTTARNVATQSVYDFVIPYGIPIYLLSDKDPQLLLLAGVCLFFCSKQLTTTAYHHQTNGQKERYKKVQSGSENMSLNTNPTGKIIYSH